MPSAAKVLLGVVKWDVVPAALGFAGYYFIGPQFSKTAPVEFKERVASALEGGSDDTHPSFNPPVEEEKLSTKFKPPKVDVKVLPAGRSSSGDGEETSSEPRRRRRVKTSEPPATVESEPEPTVPAESEPATEPPSDSSQP